MDEQIKEDIENEAIPKLSNIKKTFLVIGIVDSGVNIHHKSFNDNDILDVIDGDEWNEGRLIVSYKRKILALKCFIPPTTARETLNLDVHGHGTKCASIAASSRQQLKLLEGIEGIPSATVSGANPDARIASYKVYGIEVEFWICELLTILGVFVDHNEYFDWCPNLQLLSIKCCPRAINASMAQIAYRCRNLKQLDINYCYEIWHEFLELIGWNCPNLKILKQNLMNWLDLSQHVVVVPADYLNACQQDEDTEAAVTGKFMPQLEHLEIIS
ncbi:hypothetical protein V6N13_010497 [Hibiscus sabdariffa]